MRIKIQNYPYHMNITNKEWKRKEGYHQTVRKECEDGQELIKSITYFLIYKTKYFKHQNKAEGTKAKQILPTG